MADDDNEEEGNEVDLELAGWSDAKLHQEIFDMHQLPDAHWGGRAQAEINRRDRNFQSEQFEKQLKINKISLYAADTSAFTAAVLVIMGIIKLIADS